VDSTHYIGNCIGVIISWKVSANKIRSLLVIFYLRKSVLSFLLFGDFSFEFVVVSVSFIYFLVYLIAPWQLKGTATTVYIRYYQCMCVWLLRNLQSSYTCLLRLFIFSRDIPPLSLSFAPSAFCLRGEQKAHSFLSLSLIYNTEREVQRNYTSCCGQGRNTRKWTSFLLDQGFT